MSFTGCRIVGSAGQEYTIKNMVGKGAFATVYRATRDTTGEIVAVKVVDKKRLARKGVENQLREIEIMRSIHHPNVMHLADLLESESHLFLITEFMAGGELFDKIVSRGHFTEHDAAEILRQIAAGINYLHDNGICHRDIKPENLLCSDEDEHFRVVITDFGFSKLFGRGELMKTSCGTLHYAAPEILSGQPYSESCDVWAFGVVAYVVLTGAFPFDGAASQLGEKILAGDYCRTNLEIRHVSEPARDFIAGLLVVDAARRLTARQCLEHRWLQAEAGEASARVDLRASTDFLRASRERADAPFRAKRSFKECPKGTAEGLCAMFDFLRGAHPATSLELLSSRGNALTITKPAVETINAFLTAATADVPAPVAIAHRCGHLICIAPTASALSDSDIASVTAFVSASASSSSSVVVHALAHPVAAPLLDRIVRATGGNSVCLTTAAVYRLFVAETFAPLGTVQLALGHLHAAVSLVPDPLLALRNMRSTLPAFPSAMGVIGFLPSRLVPSPPSISAHVIVPDSGHDADSTTTTSGASPLCSVLARALLSERMTAVVALGREWCALLTVPFASPAALVLHVLRPGQSISSVGLLHKLVAYSSVALAGRVPVEVSPAVISPATSMTLPMQQPVIMPTFTSVQAALARLSRLVGQLPSTQKELFVQYDMMINASRAYRQPSIAFLAANTIATAANDAEAQAHPGAAALQEIGSHARAIIAQYASTLQQATQKSQ